MKEFKMRFKGFVFDTNPSYIQVITSRDVSKTLLSMTEKELLRIYHKNRLSLKERALFSQTMQMKNALACHIF